MTPQNQKSAEDLETRYSGGGIGSPEKACGCNILNSVIFRFFKKATDNERIFITCKLYFTEGMLEWFNLKDVRTTSANGQTTIHIYLDENEKTPDDRTDLRPNGFTRERTFHDFPIRGQEVLLHVRRRRWLDTEEHNVMTECDFVQESTRCSKELAAFLKDAFGDAPYNGPFV